VRRPISILSYLGVAALGLATMAGMAEQWLPPGVVAVAFALFVILVLPRWPGLVAAYGAGLLLAMLFAFAAFMSPEWDRCADEVDGQLVEYQCSEGSP
jgi:hypothetical protein